MNILKKMVILLSLILWPLNLYFANTLPNFVSYIIPALLLFLGGFNPIPVLLIGIFSIKLALLPVIFFAVNLFLKFSKKTLILMILSLAVIGFNFKEYRGQTVFNKDYEGEQLVLRNIQLYPNVLLARIFQNKPRIYLNKMSGNLFTLTDPNNYFFGFHPRQITVDNQNLYKFPFIAITFFLAGIYFFKENPGRKFTILSFISSIIALSVLTNYDRNDFILFIPVGMTIIYGVNTLSQKYKKVWVFLSIIFLLFTIPEIIRAFVK